MFKQCLYLITIILVLLAGCKKKPRRIWLRPVTQNETADLLVRDYSVTKENAYNDIFLDSASFEQFVNDQVPDDSISENMRDFYNIRNFEFAWFDSKGLTEQALGFRSLYKFKTDSIDKQLDRKLDELLIHEKNISPTDKSILQIELQLTRRFVQFSLGAYKETDIDNRQFETFIPIKKQTVTALADSIISDKGNKKYAATNLYYSQLKEQLIKYKAIYTRGGWPVLPESKTKYIPGNSYPEIRLLKTRLAITGEMDNKDTSAIFSPTLISALKEYQSSHGIRMDGKLSALLIRTLNVPVLHRIQQLLINMERMRWMPTKKEGKLILVNIPAFMLYVTEGDTRVIQMAVVVGNEAHNTTMFSDDLTEIVFSPYWNIPPSIVKNEILPAMRKNSNYLGLHHMEIVRMEGGLPVIRQLPGANNSLGRVKFLFPNSFNIYFHDTPSKSLFQKDDRAASHGCIRLSDPVKMANYLLEKSTQWTPEKIEAAMNSNIEKSVGLAHAVPVIITYYTAWVDENKKLNFRDDAYGNDSVYAAKMFVDGL